MVKNYFLGANTPYGFYSNYSYIKDLEEDGHLYIIKGGPGTGKSSFMKRIGKAAENAGLDVDYIWCSSDSDSLDGIIIPVKNIAFVDGTAPHMIDPAYPAASDTIINLGDFWNVPSIKTKKNYIISASKENKQQFQKAYNYLAAAKSLQNDADSVISGAINTEKMSKYINNFNKKHFKTSTGSYGCEKKRFITGLTPKGIVTFLDDFAKGAKELLIIEDCYNISHKIINEIKDAALAHSFDVIAAYSPLSPYTCCEHLFIPKLSLCIITSNKYHSYNPAQYKKISTKRFLNIDYISAHKTRLKFAKKLQNEMLQEALNAINKSKVIHDELEQFYIQNMNFKAINKLCEKMINQIIF